MKSKNNVNANNNVQNNIQADNDDLYGLDKVYNYNDYYKPIKTNSAFSDRYLFYVSNGDNNSSINEYFDKIRPVLSELIDYQKAQGEWKLQLSMKVTFVSFTDNDKKQIMYTKSDIVNIIQGYATDHIIDELFNISKQRYQSGLETRMVGNSFTFDHIDHLDYHFNMVNLNSRSTYATLPKRIANRPVFISKNDKTLQ